MTHTVNPRLEAFRSFAQDQHSPTGKCYQRLTADEIQIAEAILDLHVRLDHGQFELAINRLWLDQKEKPKHDGEIVELLCAANCAAQRSTD